MPVLIDIAAMQRKGEENIFDLYFKEIDRRKKEYPEGIKGFNFLETVLLAIERVLQDYNSEISFEIVSTQDGNTTVEYLLRNWLKILTSRNQQDICESLAYNLIPTICLIQNVDNQEFDFARYILSLYPSREFRHYTPSGKSNKHTSIDKFSEVKKILDSNYLTNAFDISGIESIPFITVDNLILKSKELNAIQLFENFIAGDDNRVDYIWDFEIIFTQKNNLYNAVEISFFIWSLAKAIESIKDIDFTIESWKDGSKKINLKAKIKTLSAKFDLKSILNWFIKLLESFYLKKSIEELKKTDAETEKIKTEILVLKKQLESLPDKELSEMQNFISLKKQLLELQEIELMQEERKAKLNIQNTETASNLMAKGAIQNNSDFEFLINAVFIVSIEDKNLTKGNTLDIVEVEEKKKLKDKDS